MKYFTPERYIAFNSADDAVADRADEDWERAMAAYRRNLKRIESQLPDKVRQFATDVCLHDAEYLGLSKISIPGNAGDLAVLSLRLDGKDYVLTYLLLAEPLVSRPTEAAIFQTDRPHWLYDEFDVEESGAVTHCILLSDGRVVSLRCVAFDLLVPQPVVAPQKRPRAVAAV